ncbi:MAG: hypothetical protein Q9200_006013 [Gallowayella weberi]
MGTKSLSTTVVHRAAQVRGAATRTSHDGGRYRSRHHQRHHSDVKRRPRPGPRTSAEEVNTVMPRRPSLTFKSQDARRKLWMLEARKQGSSLTRAHKLSNIISKLEKKLMYINRQQCREDSEESLGRVFNVAHGGRLARWRNYITQHQEIARVAGLKWARECFMNDDWGGMSVPPRQAIEQVFLHFVTPPGHDCSKGWPRHLLCLESQHLLRVYDNSPLKPGSKESQKARVRVISDMILKGALAQEQAKGLKVTSEELTEAQSAMFPADDGRWGMLPLIYTVKNIEWRGVHSWTEVEEHELPLRLTAGFGVENDKETGVEEGGCNDTAGEDMAMTSMPDGE